MATIYLLLDSLSPQLKQEYNDIAWKHSKAVRKKENLNGLNIIDLVC